MKNILLLKIPHFFHYENWSKRYNGEQTKAPIYQFFKQTRDSLRGHEIPKYTQHTLEHLHVYQYILELSNEELYASL